MPAEITMPQLSDTMTEGTIVSWLKNEGDAVKSGEPIVEIETDKATMEYEAPESGVLALLAGKAGEKIAVGGLIAVVATKGEDAKDVKKQFASGATKNASEATSAKAPAPSESSRPAPARKAEAPATMEAASSSEIHEPDEVGHGATRERATAVPTVRRGNGDDRLKASPLARRIAADKGVDLAQVQGSGPGGRVVKADVEDFIAEGGNGRSVSDKPAPSLPPVLLSGEKNVIPMTKMRTAIAAALQRSKQQIPHFYETIDIDIEQLTQLRERINRQLEKQKVRLSIADFINKAVATALKRHPALNARFNAEKGEITQYGDVNLGIAVSIPDGLIVPVLRGVDQMGLKEIRVRSADLIERARAQRLKREEQSEGTFTISSLGTFGIREFSAIINPPEVGILAVGAADKRPVFRDGQIVARTILTVTLSCDHRVVDGAVAAEFLQTLRKLLEEPAMMLV